MASRGCHLTISIPPTARRSRNDIMRKEKGVEVAESREDGHTYIYVGQTSRIGEGRGRHIGHFSTLILFSNIPLSGLSYHLLSLHVFRQTFSQFRTSNLLIKKSKAYQRVHSHSQHAYTTPSSASDPPSCTSHFSRKSRTWLPISAPQD